MSGESKPTIPASEVAALLRRVAVGEIAMLRDPENSWHDEIFGTFLVEGWTIETYTRHGFLQYIEAARAPDGRYTTYEEWFDHGGKDPVDLLTEAEAATLHDMIEGAFEQAWRDRRDEERRRVLGWANASTRR